MGSSKDESTDAKPRTWWFTAEGIQASRSSAIQHNPVKSSMEELCHASDWSDCLWQEPSQELGKPDQKLFLGRRVPEVATIMAGWKEANREYQRHLYVSFSKEQLRYFSPGPYVMEDIHLHYTSHKCNLTLTNIILCPSPQITCMVFFKLFIFIKTSEIRHLSQKLLF